MIDTLLKGAELGVGLTGGLFNFGSDRANLEHQQYLQRMQWQREDTAVQRRVADLKAAGLSPVLAAGSAAQAAPPMRTDSPRLDLEGVRNSLNTFYAQASQKAQIENMVKQNDLIQENITAAELQNQMTRATQDTVIGIGEQELRNKKTQGSILGYNLEMERLRSKLSKEFGMDVSRLSGRELLMLKDTKKGASEIKKGLEEWIKSREAKNANWFNDFKKGYDNPTGNKDLDNLINRWVK